ncbi:MAG: hypothetical protein JW728_03815, partial [Candidatus Aureabacteria bacterium]|nr:hypothetical protein [Candidatus Auribacterota bacterium]
MKIGLKETIAGAILACYKKIMGDGQCEGVSVDFDIPRNRDHGDLTTNFAMKYASSAKKRPGELSRMICDCVSSSGIEGLKRI